MEYTIILIEITESNMKKIYYDIGVNPNNGFTTIRFSNDGEHYFYVEFGSVEEFEVFVNKVGWVLELLKHKD